MNQYNTLAQDERNTNERTAQSPSRRRLNKGLPDENARLELARTYLSMQRRLWPELVRAKVLPPLTPKIVAELAGQFRDRFLGDEVPLFQSSLSSNLWKELGAAYERYSDDNSNPRSLDQQLRNILERAARDRVFIPWEYVFADASVTGTIAARRGYLLAKAVMRHAEGGPRCLYLDELGRASRDHIEALRLGKFVEALKKRMIGVSDGFDSDVPNAKVMLSIFGMLHELFIDQLRAKVLRGMTDGFFRGKNLGAAAVGYKLVPMTDKDGRIVLSDNGRPQKRKIVDEADVPHVLEAFRLFTNEKWSPDRIARRFNELKVGGMESWDGGTLRQLLKRETYIGVEFYQMTYKVLDPESGDVTLVRRPREEWKRREVPDLRIVPDDLWQQAQKRLKECHEAYLRRKGDKKDGPTRTSVYPTVLVRPVCGYCGNELWLGRSGKYASFCCLNGSAEKNGCKLRTYKSVSIVEKAVVNHLKATVFTPEFVVDLVEKANAYLRAESRRPKGNAGAIRTEIKTLEKKRDRLIELHEASDGVVDVVAAKIKSHEERLTELRGRLREVERPTKPSQPITTANVEQMVADLHALLAEDPVTVAPIIRELTGPVTVTQEKKEGKRGATWIARFGVNLAPVLARLTRQRSCPSSGAWEYLKTRGWTMQKPAEVMIDFVPKYVKLASEVATLVDRGSTLPVIATALGETYETVKAALQYARHGIRPKTGLPGKRTGTRTGPPKYQTLAPEVARLRDVLQIPFSEILRQLKVSEPIVRRAYDYAHREEILQAAQSGCRPERGHYIRLSMEERREIARRLKLDESEASIAKAVGTSAEAVRKIKRIGA